MAKQDLPLDSAPSPISDSSVSNSSEAKEFASSKDSAASEAGVPAAAAPAAKKRTPRAAKRGRPQGGGSKAKYLTERQKAILDFILSFQGEQGIAPTHREICDQFGYSSYGTVYKHLKLLEQKGYLTRDWNQKRGIQVVMEEEETEASGLPFYGKIAAGRPIEAIQGRDRLEVPGHLLSRRPGEHYVLRVAGESMIEEGIHDGDLVVVLSRDDAETGDMVVALVDDEATLKRFYPEGEQVRLQPANPQMKPIFVPADQLRIQGVVVGLMRKYL
ncbi:MAG: transcriptional repressor LexA [Acidobacteriota bacterium]